MGSFGIVNFMLSTFVFSGWAEQQSCRKSHSPVAVFKSNWSMLVLMSLLRQQHLQQWLVF